MPASPERFPLVQRNAGGDGALGKFACTGLAKLKQKAPRGWGVPWVLISPSPPPSQKAARENETLVLPTTGGGRGGTWLMLPISVGAVAALCAAASADDRGNAVSLDFT